MQTVKFVYWEEDEAWVGYLQDYPDYWTQGENFDDLKDHPRDLYEVRKAREAHAEPSLTTTCQRFARI